MKNLWQPDPSHHKTRKKLEVSQHLEVNHQKIDSKKKGHKMIKNHKKLKRVKKIMKKVIKKNSIKILSNQNLMIIFN